MPTLLAVNVGMPKKVPWNGRTVYTGVWKRPVKGRRRVRRLNIDGDGQGDLAGHGGEMRAVLVYQVQSYDYWQRHFLRDDFTYGQFGENLTVDGLADGEVCIGDRYQIGTAEFEVTQPRVTCYRVGIRLGEPDMAALLVAHRRPGFYFRVIKEGEVEAGDEIIKTVSGPGGVTVADTDALLYLPNRDMDKMRVAVRIPALSPGWQQSFRELLDEQGTGSAAPAIGVEPGWRGFRNLRVTKVVPETASVTSIYLSSDSGSALPAALPGQYLTVRISAAGSPPPVRTYSLSSAPGADTYRISVKREPHGLVSDYLQAQLKPGATIEAGSPRGEFVLDRGTNPVLLISAGIGVTPVLAMLYQLSAEHSGRDIWWLHGARRPAEQALGREAHGLLGGLARTHEYVFYSAGAGGRLTAEKLRSVGIPSDASTYICGPAVFMTDMQRALAAMGIDPGHVHVELFSPLPSTTPGLVDQHPVAPHPPPGPPGRGPLVTFARSGLTVPFNDVMSGVLELADACDVPTRWSCRTGVCHTCVTPLVSGDITYSPTPLEPPPEGQVLICCARPTSDLVLDM